MVCDNWPSGSGLSSSSAFVCASALAVLAVHRICGLHLQQAAIAEFTCRCERYVGTQSGGMDQAISIMAKPGVAKLVEFNPVCGVLVRCSAVTAELMKTKRVPIGSVHHALVFIDCFIPHDTVHQCH